MTAHAGNSRKIPAIKTKEKLEKCQKCGLWVNPDTHDECLVKATEDKVSEAYLNEQISVA